MAAVFSLTHNTHSAAFTQNEATVLRYLQMIGDPNRLGELSEICAPEIVSTGPIGGVLTGLQAVQEGLRQLRAPLGNATANLRSVFSQDDLVVIVVTAQLNPPEGAPQTVHAALQFRLKEGKILDVQSFYDPTKIPVTNKTQTV